MAQRPIDGLPVDVVAFLDEHIHSVEQLEILLLLRRTAPQAWSGETVSAHLRGNAGSAEARLSDLHQRGLIERQVDAAATGTRGAAASEAGRALYFRSPSAPEAGQASLAATLERLEEAYATRRTRIIEIIFTKPPTALREFADAFRLRRP